RPPAHPPLAAPAPPLAAPARGADPLDRPGHRAGDSLMLYRLAAELADPAAVLLLAAALLLVRLWRKGAAARGTARALLVLALLLTLLYVPAVNYLLLGSLEWDYPARAERPEGVEAIVVLGGYVGPP